jgi:hypothetical protein
MIGKVTNIVSRNEKEITVFYTISDNKYILEENKHFENTVPYKTILDYIDKRRLEIENRPQPHYEELIGEVIE